MMYMFTAKENNYIFTADSIVIWIGYNSISGRISILTEPSLI